MIRSVHSFFTLVCVALATVAGNAQESSGGMPPAVGTEVSVAAPAAPAAGATLSASKKKQERICKSIAPTGTRLAKKTCLTVAQWEEAQRIAREAAEKSQTSALMINKEGN
jgi:hypothetical protein